MPSTIALEDFDLDLEIDLRPADDDTSVIKNQFSDFCSSPTDWVCNLC